LIKNLQRKFGNTTPAILATKENLQQQLLQLQQEEEKSSSLANEWQTLSKTLSDLCIHTSQTRAILRDEFVQRMEKELADLSMGKVKMHIQIKQEKTTETEDSIQIQGEHYRLFPDGIDTLQYLVSTNPGQPMHPLSKIASGGELSRFMLALKSLIGKLENVDTLLFDEIDTGIGGITADQVGVKCRDLAHDKQLICITHLPQIAAKGQHHFVIDKTVHDTETNISISPVKGEARMEEITRMLGEPYSEASKQLARSMLEWSS